MSGRLKHKVTFYSIGKQKDSFGVVTKESETKVMSARCNVQVISGSERVNSGVALDSEFISVLLRFDTRIKHDLIMSWKGNRYNIDNIRPDDKNMKVIVQASREIRNG